MRMSRLGDDLGGHGLLVYTEFQSLGGIKTLPIDSVIVVDGDGLVIILPARVMLPSNVCRAAIREVGEAVVFAAKVPKDFAGLVTDVG